MQEMKILISSDIIDICDSIVEHYNCSSECKGMCCKIQKIDFSSKEYFNMLSKVDEKHREILRTQTEYANIASKVKICNLPHDILRKLERERVRQFKTNICHCWRITNVVSINIDQKRVGITLSNLRCF